MKKAKFEEIRTEYRRDDFGKGVRGKHFGAYQKGTNLVLLSPDVARVFPNDRAVNEALRSLINLSQKKVAAKKRPTRRSKKSEADPGSSAFRDTKEKGT